MKRLFLTAITAFAECLAFGLPTTHYVWFDRSPELLRFEGESLITDLDVSALSDGVHTLSHVAVDSRGILTPPVSSVFFKTPSLADGSVAECYAVVDDSSSEMYRCTMSGGCLHVDMDMSDLQDGLHRLTVFVRPAGSTALTTSSTAWFLKAPAGGTDIRSYCYWIDGYDSDAVTVNFEHPAAIANIVDLMDIKQYPLQTASFEIEPDNAGNLTMLARHSFNFWAMDASGRLSPAAVSEYVDNRTTRVVHAESIMPLTTCEDKSIGIIGADDVKWFRFDGEVGDSLVLRTSEAATFELFDHSGKRLLTRKGSSAQAPSSLTLRGNGTCYLAVHDAQNKRKGVRLDFQHISRNAILSVSPEVCVASNTFSRIDVHGNGLFDAKKIILTGTSGTRYEADIASAFDNYNLSTVVGMDTPLTPDTYDVTLLFDDSVSGESVSVTKSDAVHIVKSASETPRANIVAEIIPSLKPGTPYMVEVRVTNDSEVACWGIPFNIACESNGGKNEFQFYMTDILGNKFTCDEFLWYETDNILGTGVNGIYHPIVFDYMQPHEVRTMYVSIVAPPHEKVGIYAWAGEPYNEEAARLLSMTDEKLAAEPLYMANYMGVRHMLYLEYVLEEHMDKDNGGMRKACAQTDNTAGLEYLGDLTVDAAGRLPGMERPSDYASKTANTAQNIGRTIAGISNSSQNMHAYEFFKDNNIPGNNMSEMLAYIEDNNMVSQLQPYYDMAKRNMARSMSPRDIFADYLCNMFNVPDCHDVTDCFQRQSSDCPTPAPDRSDIESLQAYDPNDIKGYTDPTGGNYVGMDVRRLNYEVEFENDPALANAPASMVELSGVLDPSVFDLATFTPESVTIGGREVELPHEHEFVKTVDLRPEIECIAEIRLTCSETTGTTVLTLSSLDPVSLLPVENYRQGLLPVNEDGVSGMGTFRYSVALREGLEHGLSFGNKASIVFDSNDPIETPEWTNVTDYKRPVASIVKSYGHDGSAYAFDVEFSDEGSGVRSFDLCARTGNDQEWRVVMPNLTEKHVVFATPEPIEGMQFNVRAIDRAGNRQTENYEPTDVRRIESDTDESRTKWYDVHGIEQAKDAKIGAPKVIISNTGRKVLVR